MKDPIQLYNRYHMEIFIIALLLIYIYLGYIQILTVGPSGIHFIRQTDSLSFASNYYHGGMNFFSPGVYNLDSNGGKAACEFPIIYYITALLYFVFGEHDIILRLINACIMTFGLFNLYRLLLLITKSKPYSMIFSLMFFSSGVIVYYTNNFLPDTAGLGLILSGWYYFYDYFTDRTKRKSLYLSFFFFTLGSLIKVTLFTSPIAAWSGLLLYDLLIKKVHFVHWLRKNFGMIAGMLVITLMIISWNLYARFYNNLHHDTYFLTNARPIWDMDKMSRAIVWDHIRNYWYSQYYYQSVFHFFAGLILLGLFFIKKSEKAILIISALMLLGALSFIVLFYAQFKDHDYYFIALIPSIIFLVVQSYLALNNRIPVLFSNPVSMTALTLLCALSLHHAGHKIDDRYQSRDCFNINATRFAGAAGILDNAGIPKDATFIILRDSTKNGSLYFMKRHGWPVEDTNRQGIERLNVGVANGVNYIVLTDSAFARHPEITKTLGKKVISTKDWAVYSPEMDYLNH